MSTEEEGKRLGVEMGSEIAKQLCLCDNDHHARFLCCIYQHICSFTALFSFGIHDHDNCG